MHDETVETYTNVYARWFAIISQFIVTASLCTLWRLQMTLLGWVWGAVLVISAVSATFCEASGIMVEAQHHKLTTTY